MCQLMDGCCVILVTVGLILFVITNSYACQSCCHICDNHVALFKPLQEARYLLHIPLDVVAQVPEASEELPPLDALMMSIDCGVSVLPSGSLYNMEPYNAVIVILEDWVVHPTPVHFIVTY